MQDHVAKFAALAAVELVTEIPLNMHQHVGVIFPRGRFLQDGHQLFAVRHKEGVQIFPLVQRGNERADFTITRLMVRQQLKFVAAVEI